MKFRKKPVEIEAFQWNGTTFAEGREFCETNKLPAWPFGQLRGRDGHVMFKGVVGLVIETLEGELVARQGDWIVRGVNGEYYPCKPDIFEKTHERIEEEK